MLLRPQLDAPQGQPEVVHVGHLEDDHLKMKEKIVETYLTQNLISDSATVETFDAFHVKVLEDHRIAQVLIVAHLLQCQPG